MKPRSIEESKRSRVGHRAPFNHADKREAEEVLAKADRVDGETWAAGLERAGRALGRKEPRGGKPPASATKEKLFSNATDITR